MFYRSRACYISYHSLKTPPPIHNQREKLLRTPTFAGPRVGTGGASAGKRILARGTKRGDRFLSCGLAGRPDHVVPAVSSPPDTRHLKPCLLSAYSTPHCRQRHATNGNSAGSAPHAEYDRSGLAQSPTPHDSLVSASIVVPFLWFHCLQQ